jgi:hypothetical protein
LKRPEASGQVVVVGNRHATHCAGDRLCLFGAEERRPSKATDWATPVSGAERVDTIFDNLDTVPTGELQSTVDVRGRAECVLKQQRSCPRSHKPLGDVEVNVPIVLPAVDEDRCRSRVSHRIGDNYVSRQGNEDVVPYANL